jgi:hypothetical protein
MFRLVSFVLIAIFVLASVLSASAQGSGLPADQQALLDRVLQAIAASDSYSTFVHETDETRANTQSIHRGEKTATSSQTSVFQRATHFIDKANGQANIDMLMSVQVTEQTFAAEQPVAYSLEGELRLVDGVLYVQAQRQSDSEDSLPPMPDGWVIVTNADDWPALDVLQLEARLRDVASPDVFSADIALLLQEATSATLTRATLDDGTPVDQITLVLTGDDMGRGAAAFATATDDRETTAILYDHMDLDQSSWTMVFSLNDQDQIVHYAAETQMVWTDFDVHLISPQTPEGTLLSQTNTMSASSTLSGIGEPLEPVPAPEITAE